MIELAIVLATIVIGLAMNRALAAPRPKTYEPKHPAMKGYYRNEHSGEWLPVRSLEEIRRDV